MPAELIPVNIVLGDRTYRIKIATGDEEHVRRTIKIINEKILEFKTQFAGQDMQDYVAMVLVWYATQVGGAAPASMVESTVIKELAILEEQLDRAIAQGESVLPEVNPRRQPPE
ncbi:cell division protein ZapA [Dinghuibacter silviterrae]|uniref:Cell division protein ZapA n=1 Tax=Dinghuibacter silviterrae TaxID=1539049 RepID=A0A4R8DQX1_9BACT|nr:cell division protein ZapA [Dinghuibacter silviterrae]TDX00216.1 cell division protein ZapA [Dinghuibacter silviterrae]